MMNLSLLDLVAIVASNGLILWLVSKWLEARLQASIKHEYDKKLEDYRNSTRTREQAARVVDLLAYVHYTTNPDPEKFNRMAWELSLWLPADLVWELTQMLCGASKKDPKEFIVIVRRILLQNPNDKLEPGQIVHMPRSNTPLPAQSLGASGTGS